MEGKGEVLFISPSHLDVALIRVPLSSLSRTLYLSFNEKDWVLSPIRRNENIQVGDSISILGLGNFLSLSPLLSLLFKEVGWFRKSSKGKGKLFSSKRMRM